MKNLFIFIVIFTAMLFFIPGVHSQSGIRGRVTDALTGEPLPGASLVLNDKNGTQSDEAGYYSFDKLAAGDYRIVASYIGYKQYESEVSLKQGRKFELNIRMEAVAVQMSEIVVTASRYEEKLQQIPLRMHVISRRELEMQVSTSADEMINFLPGVNISRSFGIFSSKSTVSMRGLGGNEQSRVLVLADGIPINKSDGGSVNWNLLNTQMIERIEVVKGPNSSIYGGNAMGGTINLISKKPSKPLSLRASLEYGTYQTMGARLSLSGKALQKGERFFYWTYGGMYRKSDGYVTQSAADQAVNPYITKSNLKENGNQALLGYQFAPGHSLELSAVRYDDRRGTGEVVFQEEGNVTDHDIWQFMSRYQRTIRNTKGSLSVFYNHEAYKKVNEYMKDDYTFYKVLSNRVDYGGMFSLVFGGLKNHRIIAGLDVRNGSVDARDEYITSTDIVYNKGGLSSFGLFVQDETDLVREKLKLLGGIRFDHARFGDGSFYIEAPTGETEFMMKYVIRGFRGDAWSDVSPRLSLQYRPGAKSRYFIQYAHGFRAPVLDDMCRSGRMRGGFKVINPDLKPERLDNFELGADFTPISRLRAGLSLYYSVGSDFQYYVGTGDSLDMGFGLRPVMIRDNISRVHIAGAELSIAFQLLKDLDLQFSYALNESVIEDYTPLNPLDQVDLSGNFLSEVPVHTASLTARFTNAIADLGLGIKYNGKRYVNDQNAYDDIVLSDRYPDYLTVDIRISKDYRHWSAALNVQNLTDELYYDSKGAVCPGRFILVELGYRL